MTSPRSVDDHLARVLERIPLLHPLEVQLLEAHGCVLAEDVTAPTDLPPWDNSGMDGYAVVAADVEHAVAESPVVLPVVGDVPAGSQVSHRVQPGQVVRIMTGAPMPEGADAVVPVEWTDAGTESVTVRQAAALGQHVRRRGDDVRAGEVVLPQGTRLGPAHVGLLAAVGRARVRVHPRPRVVIISTGSELVEPGAALGHGQIPDSNGPGLTAAAREAGAVVYRVGIVPDDPTTLLSTIEDQLVRADLVLTTGGVSAGAYDVVKEVLSGLGTVEFTPVAMQPGKPQGFGTVGPDATPIFTLPGNPVSAHVSFEVFVRPAIRRMLGFAPLQRPVVRARSTAELSSRPGVRQFLRGVLTTGADGVAEVAPASGQGSHLLAGLARANALIVLREEVEAVAAGDEVEVMVLERRAS
ncbi:molybdopterin molybdochelatase [Motilibacter rhizosphaerae]|uniref:Molybdopterin molybdenumtransferase n=1 Tax=Motilibacter rhizosphaerae TaxID=598652 RepID=A0A4Q7NS31_9ACTN|nr:gephyrin-like molybdotransferase Glp [Motilibacter rhizosphaerae]RZS87460.1 molybdopterin molybdochelatase [Motilibacter rhizosphaerae]